MHKTAAVLALESFVQAKGEDHHHGFVGDGVPPREPSVYEANCETEVADSVGLVATAAVGSGKGCHEYSHCSVEVCKLVN